MDVPGCEPYKEYLYTYLRDQTIWHSLRFWNAAFFDALQCERVHRPVVTREDIQHNSLEAITDEKQYQENITFGQLGYGYTVWCCTVNNLLINWIRIIALYINFIILSCYC